MTVGLCGFSLGSNVNQSGNVIFQVLAQAHAWNAEKAF
jgi:hypothetical protein